MKPAFDDEEAAKSLCKEEEAGLKGNIDHLKDWIIESLHRYWEQEHPDASSDLSHGFRFSSVLLRRRRRAADEGLEILATNFCAAVSLVVELKDRFFVCFCTDRSYQEVWSRR